MRDELQRLVNDPVESLEVELKSNFDLNDDRHRAHLARHIAALANYGGGVIIFGFNDDLSPTGAGDDVLVDRDVVSSIVKKYLEPPLQCEVRMVTSAKGQVHPIIVVPGHGAAPICARAGGPEDRGKPVGIVKGTYYLRKVGPASEPIVSATEWAPLIRRCTIHDRQALFAALNGALAPDSLSQPPTSSIWHKATQTAALAAVADLSNTGPYETGWKQFSYVIDPSTRLSEAIFPRILTEVNYEVHDRVQTGWSMFYPFGPPQGEYWNTDPQSGDGEHDFLECSLGRDPRMAGRDFWRISPSGKASLLREYWEDSSFQQQKGVPAGTLFDIDLFAQNVAELVRHAQGISARIDGAETVTFICEVTGLQGRRGGTLQGYLRSFGDVARTSNRLTAANFPITTLSDQWPEIVERLAAPIARIFNAEDLVSARANRANADRWRRL